MPVRQQFIFRFLLNILFQVFTDVSTESFIKNKTAKFTFVTTAISYSSSIVDNTDGSTLGVPSLAQYGYKLST